MPTVLCLDDFTCGLSDAVQLLGENGYQVLAADDGAAALEVAASTPLDAVILNCHRDRDNLRAGDGSKNVAAPCRRRDVLRLLRRAVPSAPSRRRVHSEGRDPGNTPAPLAGGGVSERIRILPFGRSVNGGAGLRAICMEAARGIQRCR